MEYEFIHDTITGLAKAKFSFDHQVMGPWLEVEVGQDATKLTQVLTAMNDIQSGQNQEIVITGHEYSVSLSADDVEVHANALLNGEEILPEQLKEDNIDFDLNASSCCGMEDFRELLLSWATFTRMN